MHKENMSLSECFIFYYKLQKYSSNINQKLCKIQQFWKQVARGEVLELNQAWRFLCIEFSSIQRSVVSDSLRPHCTAACQASLSIINSRSLLKFMSIELVMPSNHLIHYHPLLLLPSIFPSIKVFSNESVLHIRWPKYQSFSFSISPSNEYSGLISFRMDQLDFLAVQGTLKSLFQTIMWNHQFFSAQPSLWSNDHVWT